MNDYEQYKKPIENKLITCADCRYFLSCECFGNACRDFTLHKKFNSNNEYNEVKK